MGTQPSRSPEQSRLMKGLTDGLGEELIFFGMIALGCLLFIAASISMHYGVASKAELVQEELEKLPYAPGQPAGTRAVLTGTIANDAKPLLKNFVAYVEEDYHSGGKYDVAGWEFVSGKTQTFRVDTPNGRMELASPSYDLSPRAPETNKALLPDWDHAEARVDEPSGTFERAKRYRGLIPGGPVTAIGTVTPEDTFEAEYVIGTNLKDAQEMIAPVASGESSSFDYWLTLIGVAGLAVTIGAFVRRRLRSVREHLAD